jgi:cell division protease FtsH
LGFLAFFIQNFTPPMAAKRKLTNNSSPPKQPESPVRNPFGNFWWIYLLLFGVISAQFLFSGALGAEEISWSRFKSELLPKGEIEKIVVVNKDIAEIYLTKDTTSQGIGFFKKSASPSYVLKIGSVEAFETALDEAQKSLPTTQHAELSYETRTNWLWNIMGWVLPFVLIVVMWFWIMRRATGGAGMGGGMRSPFDFGKISSSAMEQNSKAKVNFDDVAGMEEAKEEIREIVEFLKKPAKYTRLGAKIPKGVLVIGPPGTGKTLLARAVAGEANVPFFSISGSEFVEMFVGVGASRVRDLFRKAKEKAPSIIFIDEIDAVGRSRSRTFSMASNDERESTLNQLLTEMDGFDNTTGVIVLAATNRGDMLDRALLRPGRFDRTIYLELPNKSEREAIFKVHLRQLKLASEVKVDVLAAQTHGFSGADIANICNEAALIAARQEKEGVEMSNFYDAIDRVIAGLEKKSKIISHEEKVIVAYHEAGHATASWFLKYADTLMKVSIVPRGKSLGAAWYMPEEHLIFTKEQFLDRICMALGGRAAEEITFGKISSGALDDLEKVTKQAYSMVAFYGLDEEVGNISFYDSNGEYRETFQKPYSEATAELIDQRVRTLVEAAYDRTKKLLLEHQDKLATLATLLLEKEVLVQEDLELIFGKRPAAAEAKPATKAPRKPADGGKH